MFNIEKWERQVDEAIASQTPEMVTQWLFNKRAEKALRDVGYIVCETLTDIIIKRGTYELFGFTHIVETQSTPISGNDYALAA